LSILRIVCCFFCTSITSSIGQIVLENTFLLVEILQKVPLQQGFFFRNVFPNGIPKSLPSICCRMTFHRPIQIRQFLVLAFASIVSPVVTHFQKQALCGAIDTHRVVIFIKALSIASRGTTP
jgi:hypothetical protein